MYSNETDALLATGGLKQEGGMVDEESGNNVPAGSTREEVRDDIDAKLSTGEFVFPADVVRYFGLAKLMELRDEAKRGLKKMEDIGQMGNAADVEDADALHGEEMAPETPEEPEAFAEGGYVGGARSAALYKRSPIKGFEMVPMEDNNGNVIYIPYINGEPQLNVPEGYRVKTANSSTPTAPTTPTALTTSTTTPEDRGGDNNNNAPVSSETTTDIDSGMTGKGYTIDAGGFAQPDKMNTSIAKVAGMAASFLTGIPVLAPVISTIADFSNKENVKAADAYNSLMASESLGGVFATSGKEGTGGAAASIGRSIADNISLSGFELDPSSIAAATQAAATATITGSNRGSSFVQAAAALAVAANIDPKYALDIVTGTTGKFNAQAKADFAVYDDPTAARVEFADSPLAATGSMDMSGTGTALANSTYSAVSSPVSISNPVGTTISPATGLGDEVSSDTPVNTPQDANIDSTNGTPATADSIAVGNSVDSGISTGTATGFGGNDVGDGESADGLGDAF